MGLCVEFFAELPESTGSESAGHRLAKVVIFETNIVGFVMYGPDPDDGHIRLYRLMTDRRFQRRGFGRLALREVVRAVCHEFGVQTLRLGVAPKNGTVRPSAVPGEKIGSRPTLVTQTLLGWPFLGIGGPREGAEARAVKWTRPIWLD
ncbi:GNAT family N-acetyltransferase [Mycobacterium sp. 20091114027_K0903767]|nr:GNAT family N-acetyltransferase [Mycobacterium sp. 20091114027_K0903767]